MVRNMYIRGCVFYRIDFYDWQIVKIIHKQRTIGTGRKKNCHRTL